MLKPISPSSFWEHFLSLKIETYFSNLKIYLIIFLTKNNLLRNCYEIIIVQQWKIIENKVIHIKVISKKYLKKTKIWLKTF